MILNAAGADARLVLKKAADIILAGGIVAVPTETVYGLAANALDADAVRKIFTAKGRPFIDPLIVHVSDFGRLEKIAEPNGSARRLYEAFCPGPITFVLNKKPCVPGIVSAGKPTVAVRIPSHKIMREFMEIAGVPLSAPSANPFGYVSPTKAEHVESQLGDKIDAVIDGGCCECGVESTIVMLADESRPMLLRPGPVPRAQIEEVLGKKLIDPKDKNPAHPAAPGMLKTHYSPRAKVVLFGDSCECEEGAARVFFTRPEAPQKGDFWLSENSDLKEAARNLFDLLRRLDSSYKKIYCQRLPNDGIGEAVNDRLGRAAAK
ncbi:MAG: threonylcarbamoyl-AMP synthase [Opitutales bacterium]|nr:threonylcarbamoyl-AMP synthase [Opitutales bacterium]